MQKRREHSKVREVVRNDDRSNAKSVSSIEAEIDALPEEDRRNLIELYAEREEYFSGPIPDPSLLERYGNISPEWPERIWRLTKDEQDFRHDVVKKQLEDEILTNKRAQWFAFILSVLLMGCGVLVIRWGSTIGGTVLAGLGISSIIVAFIRSNNKDNDSK